MSLAFDNIGNGIRTPGFFFEFNNALAAIASTEFALLLTGQQLASATVAAGELKQLSSAAQAETYYGRGSMLHEMAQLLFGTLSIGIKVMAIGLADDAAGVAATGSLEVTAASTQTGTLVVSINGNQVRIAVDSGDSDEDIAAAIVAAITANTSLPVTAAIDGVDAAIADLTCRWKGETGNDIDIRTWFEQGRNLVAGPPITITAMNGGTTNPDIATAITAMGDEWFNWIVMPYTDAANLTALEAELLDRWGPLQQIDGRAFIAYRDTLANTSTFGNGRNSFNVTCMGTSIAPQAPYLWAAVNAAEAAKSLSIDPARPLQRRVLKGILPPDPANRFTQAERNVLLFDGIATHTVDRDGTVRIERQITMYQTNDAGQADASYLDINTPETLSRFRQLQRTRLSTRFPNHKLAEDGAQFGPGDDVATPTLIRGALLSIYREAEGLGWVEDYDTYAETLQVEVGDGQGGGDRNRANIHDRPNLVNQLRIYAQQSQFVV